MIRLVSLLLATAVWLSAAKSSWTEHPVPARDILTSGSFVDDVSGWVIGPQTVLHTMDGAKTWYPQTLPDLDNVWLTAVQALSDSTAVITASAYGRNKIGMVVRTEDSGRSWTKLALRKGTFSSVVFHADRTRGYLISSSQGLLRTNDRGISWAPVRMPRPLVLRKDNHQSMISLPDDKTAWVASRNGLWRSDNDGADWQWVPLPIGEMALDAAIHQISFATSQIGWALLSGNTLETRDGGRTWAQINVSGLPYAVSSERVWILSSIQAWQSKDSGRSWVPNLSLDQRKGRLIGLAFTPTRVFALGGTQAIRQPYIAERSMIGNRHAAEDVAVNVPIRVAKPGFVGLQIQNNANRVVQNMADIPAAAGESAVQWDLSTVDDLWRDTPRLHNNLLPEADNKTLTADSGRYLIRGIWRPQLDLRYSGSFLPIKDHGMPWLTEDRRGGWVGDLKPASTIAATSNGMWLGAYAKKGDALIQCDLNMEKLWGTPRIQLACPRVMTAAGDHLYFVDHGLAADNLVLIQFNTITRQVRRVRVMGRKPNRKPQISGIAVTDNRLYLADRMQNQILVCTLDSSLTRNRKNPLPLANLGRDMSAVATILNTFSLPKPGRIRVLDDRHLLVVSDDRIVQIHRGTGGVEVVVSGLVNPLGLAVDGTGNFFVGEMAPQHQVKMYSRDGRMLRSIGLIGPHRIGEFDRNNLESPAGLAVAADGNLWVCEANDELRRVSVWDRNGTCVRQVIGPALYSGGGTIDPQNPNRFFYLGKEFHRDSNGKVSLTRILWRRNGLDYDSFAGSRRLNSNGDAPSHPFYNNRSLFFSQWGGYGMGNVNTIWRNVDDHLRPVAAVGVIPDWLRERLSLPVDSTIFAWTDRDRDGRVQARELTTGTLPKPDSVWGTRVSKTFEVAFSALTGRLGFALFRVQGATPDGNPLYELPQAYQYVDDIVLPPTQQIQSVAMDSLGQPILCGPYLYGVTRGGRTRWRYPNRWPSLFDSLFTSASGAERGMIIGGTRFMGITQVGTRMGDIACLGTNFGSAHLISGDGIYIGQVFRDVRRGRSWTFNSLPTSADLHSVSLGQEHFGGTFQRVVGPDGRERYMMVVSGAGGTCSVVEIANLGSIQRLSDTPIAVFEEQAAVVKQQAELRQPYVQPTAYLQIQQRTIHVDGDLAEWPEEQALGMRFAYDDRFLYIGYQRQFGFPGFENAATAGDFLECFRRGNGLELHFSTEPTADPNRTAPVKGDRRLVICKVDGTLQAVLFDYRRDSIMPLAKIHYPTFWSDATVDHVEILPGAVIAGREGDTYQLEAAIPLQALGLQPTRIPRIRADFGIDLGDQTGRQTIERAFWSNPNTKLISDVTSEVTLTPRRWGTFHFIQP